MNNYEYEVEINKYIDEKWNIAKSDREQFFYKLHSEKHICLFGAGNMGIDIANYMKSIGVNIDFFCDNNENLWGKEICLGIKCISVEELLKYKNEVFVFISTGKYKEIVTQLQVLDFNIVIIPTSLMLKSKNYLDTIDSELLKSNIQSLLEILEDENSKMIVVEIIKKWFMPISEYDKYNYNEINSGIQYLPKNIVNLSKQEVFVDVGAYDGDTIKEFLLETNNTFEKILAYEIDKNCYKKLNNNIKGLDENIKNKIVLYNMGLYDKNEDIKYSSNDTSSVISSSANENGKVVRLSDHAKDENITFIKMDIEGAEPNALEGAKDSITKYKPKLAICVYHEPYHLWEIPLFIKSLIPEYKIFIRHHSDFNVDTVCYAIL